MIIISAMSKDRVIGSRDGMPWSVPAEYEQYLRFVSGQTVILGRKSYDIFGPDLPEGTTAVVISRSSSIENAHVTSSLAEALMIAEGLGKQVFVAGGGSIYGQALPLADEMYLSTIKGDFEGDAWFPEFDSNDWRITEERDEPKFVFRKHQRKTPTA